MENIASLKEKWFKKEVERLGKSGISKADISRALDIKPQYLNSVLNGSRSLTDPFLDKFIEIYKINQFDLFPNSITDSDSVLAMRFMDKLEEKETKIDQLQTELREKSEELAVLKSQQPSEGEHGHIRHGDAPPPHKGLGL